jgi:hypothetical protein
MRGSGLLCRRQLTAFFAVIVIALACISPGSPSSFGGVKTFGLPAIHAGVSPHLALVAQDRGKQQLIACFVAVLAETVGADSISPATDTLSAPCPASFWTAPVRIDGSRAPPQLLFFA